MGTTSPAAILSVGAPAGTAPLMVGSTTKTLLQVGAKGKLEVLDVGTGYSGVVSSLRQLGFQTGTTTTWTGSTTGAYINKLVVPFAGTIRQAICDTDTGTLGVYDQGHGEVHEQQHRHSRRNALYGRRYSSIEPYLGHVLGRHNRNTVI